MPDPLNDQKLVGTWQAASVAGTHLIRARNNWQT